MCLDAVNAGSDSPLCFLHCFLSGQTFSTSKVKGNFTVQDGAAKCSCSPVVENENKVTNVWQQKMQFCNKIHWKIGCIELLCKWEFISKI